MFWKTLGSFMMLEKWKETSGEATKAVGEQKAPSGSNSSGRAHANYWTSHQRVERRTSWPSSWRPNPLSGIKWRLVWTNFPQLADEPPETSGKLRLTFVLTNIVFVLNKNRLHPYELRMNIGRTVRDSTILKFKCLTLVGVFKGNLKTWLGLSYHTFGSLILCLEERGVLGEDWK